MGHRETRSRLAIKMDAAKRMAHWYCVSGIRPHYLVVEYPKSGGSWVSQLISGYLDIPFPRNQSIALFQRTCLLHGHHLYSPFFKNAVYVVRDGRDVMTSAYFHCLFENDRNPEGMVQAHRALLPLDDYDDVYGNLPKFIEYMFTIHSKKRFHFSWSDFVQSIDFDKANVVKYEELITNTTDAISGVLKNLTGKNVDARRLDSIVATYSFSNQVKRNPGEENRSSFLRKGISGDWKEKFSKESRKVFDQFAGDALISAGYEPDRQWIQTQ